MKLGRYFGLKRSVLCNINEEKKFPSEKCYQMLLYYKQHYGSSAEFKTLAAGLEHPLVQRRDLAYKYCYITTGFGQIGRELRTIPPEIKARGLEAELAYENALRIGKVKVYRARIILIGQDRAGKTSLKKSLLGLRFDPEEQSTSGIEVDPSSFEVNVDQESQADADRHNQYSPKTPHLMSNSSDHHMERSDHQNSQIKIDTSKPPEEFCKSLIQYLKGLNLQSSSAEPVVHIDIWDLAGQQLYYASHPVFLSTRALYLLVFNLSKGLQDTAVSYVRQGIHNRCLENPTGETNLKNLLSWPVSIDAFSPIQQEAGKKQTPYLRPPVLMVGTHADKPFQDIEEMNVQIRKKLSEKRCGRHVNTQYFSVDNTQSSSDAGIIKLRDEILKVLKREPYMGEQVPVRAYNPSLSTTRIV
ncbi:probable serine/threonine-protein kinase roco5 isoform X2 [Stylophora pistillata]|uniref:probable serine/threonine-protein kinase roco5 isoform X2 n=1 Tax=Stylophora pistillata TaxID=50429 RepID=UPI000C045A97|nr:probable serine/threonine-protein kinase roco5 isoform X2 [Stylophora pistillata]XP_022798215.1 probable serine/threonine-protein kinase roco5 isoform X2 [Stylophora pistillata]